MKNFAATLLGCGLLLACIALPLGAMPPHPDLLAQIRNHTAPEPYFLQHIDELHARGIESSTEMHTLQQLHRRSLDEDINILAILVDFDDHPSQVQPWRFDSLLFGQANHTLNHYYNQVSYGNLTLVTVNLPSTLGWQRAPQPYTYYVDGQNGTGAYPNNSQKLTEDVVQMVDSVVDFSQYDNDGDGHVDALFIIHSGRGAEFTGNNNDIWSHAWQTHNPQYLDGVIVDRYSTEPEYWQMLNDMTCGVYAHEMGHAVFGLPDLYDYNYTSEGLGTWTLMAGGSWNGANGNSPAHPDAWCRIQMGFAEATNVTANLANVSIPQIETSPVVYRLWANGTQGSEYYLVENRQQHGYDVNLHGNGLLIYHVDDTRGDNNNPWFPGHTSNHYKVALEQADGRFDLEHNANAGDIEDPYPSWDSLYFANGTTPSSRSYAGTVTRVTVRNISASADTMTADLAVRPGVGNLVFVQIPDTIASPGDTMNIPVVVDSVTGQNITSLHLTLSCDSAIAVSCAPYYDLTGGLLPPSWTATQTHSNGTIAFDASGATPLSGQGLLLKLRLRILPGIASGSITPLVFQRFLLNQDGNPAADVPRGSITVAVAHIQTQPISLGFGTVQIGSSSQRTLLMRNTGTGLLIINSVTISAPYTTNFTTPRTVLPGGWSPLQITFTPTAAESYPDTLLIASNADTPLAQVPVSGQGTTLSAEGVSDGVPSQFALTGSYPNPFNPSTTLGYDIPRSAQVTLQVFDVLGRLVDTPVSGVVEPGHHSLSWSCPSCGSGIYLFVLSAENRHFTQKAMLLK